MKRHIEEPAPQMIGNKPEGLYSRSPPAHIIGPMANLQNVQNILHMANQAAPASTTQTLYSKEVSMTTVYHYPNKPNAAQPVPQLRHKVHTSTNIALPGPGTPPGPPSATPHQNFQRLKVEDALSYLDKVKYKFASQPQVYNDFLDIMKEFKSQSIDTPGVIQRVSNLFKGHPELIVGFNTFLPPGYKIEVQSNEQGYAFQVSVSMPSPTTASTTTLIQASHHALIPHSEPLQILSTVKHAGPPVPPRSVSPPPPPSQYPPATGQGLLAQSTFSALPIQQQQAHLAVSHALNSVDSQHPHPTPPSQPVEFNHAINYVNKIKNRFQGQPDKYKKFLEILHTYQKEQRNAKEASCGPAKPNLTEVEVYSQVSKLFEHQEDLLAEFGQFLPDATNHLNAKNLAAVGVEQPPLPKKPVIQAAAVKTLNVPRDSSGSDRETPRPPPPKPTPLKRSPSFSATPKKQRPFPVRDGVTIAEAGKYASLNDYAFFDKVYKALNAHDVYINFLRCLNLYAFEIVCKSEVVQMVTPFLARNPELIKSFKEFVGFTEQTNVQSRMELIPNARQDRPQGEHAMEIDYLTCKRLGTSYCALPKTYQHPKTSGRTALCREVLNDTWVSFPSWAEDSTFVTSRKTVFEEYIYRCEDERFELDVVIESNGATIRALEGQMKKISRLSPEESTKYRMDDCLGGTSPTIHIKAINRVYGDKAADVIDGLKKSPATAIPVVLRRLRAKDDEWRESQKGFNKIWREQNEKYYLKSLDHLGINFKQTDAKYLGFKSLCNEIESIFEERQDGMQDGPHLILPYKDKSILDDASNLLIHHAKRSSGVQKEDKHKMKVILRHVLPDLFQHPRQDLSDDEKDDDAMEVDEEKPADHADEDTSMKMMTVSTVSEGPCDGGESYSLFMANNSWYLFLRLHQILCKRLTKMYKRAEILAVEEAADKLTRADSTSVALRLKPKLDVEVCDYYPTLLDYVKSVLDGNMESSTYEDNLREMFGIHAYHSFTLDKVVTYAVRQLQHIVSDETPQQCLEQFIMESKRGGAGGPSRTEHQRANLEASYQKRMEQLMTEESCYKVYIYHKDCRLTVELLDTELNEPDAGDTLKWAAMRDAYVEEMREFPDDDLPVFERPVFRKNNIRVWKENAENQPELKSESESIGLRMGDQSSNSTVGGDNSECLLRLNNVKVMFVINKDNLLYRKNALTRAKQSHPRVTRAKHFKLRRYQNKWVEENCSEADLKICTDWLMGKGPDMVPNNTVVCRMDDPTRTPYVPYNRYKVTLLED